LQRMEWNTVNPLVNYANTLDCQSGFQFGPRINSDHQMIYISKGTGTVEIERNEYKAAEGDLFYYGPDVIHTFIADKLAPFELIGVHFDWHADLISTNKTPTIKEVSRRRTAEYTKENLVYIGEKGLDELKISDLIKVQGTEIPQLLLEIVKHSRNNSEKSALAGRVLFSHLLLLLHKLTHTVTPSLSPAVKLLFDVKAKLELAASQVYSRKWLTEWSGYNEDYFSRSFHQQFGVPPHQYHQMQKIKKAKELLEHTSLSASSIADKLSLSSIHYFCRLFKAQTGYTPLGYRKMCRMV